MKCLASTILPPCAIAKQVFSMRPLFTLCKCLTKSLFRQSPVHMDLHSCFLSCCLYLTMPSNRFLNHLIVSSLLTLCCLPIFDLHRRLLATRAPGRVLDGRLASIY